jgi:tetratricopeptide (TPR) repeat protein
MDSKVKLADIRHLITQAKNEEAAQQLLAYLATAPEPARSWQNTVSNLLAQYKRVIRQQQRSTISLEDANLTINKITDGLLASVAGIEEGLPAPALKDIEESDRRNIPLWLIVSVITALVLATASFFMLRGYFQSNTPEDDDLETVVVDQGTSEEGMCPVYAPNSDFNIMILPFQPLDGLQRPIERSLRIRLANEMEKYGVKGSIFTKQVDVFSNAYPLTSTQAAAIGKPCKAQLIIWGTTEQQAGNDLVTTKFRFIDSEHFTITDLELNNEVKVDTVSSLSSIATSAELTESIEKTIRLIFGLVAYETEHHAVAAKAIGEAIEERGGVEENTNWGRIQADSYIKSGQDERAIEIYRQILKKDSSDIQARLQKGLLEYKIGDKTAADEDFTNILAQDPDNTKARTARAAINVNRNDLYQAKGDLEMLEKNPEREVVVNEIRKDYDRKHVVAEQQIQLADQQIKQNPKDTSAWRVKAQASAQIGEYQTASKSASKLLSLDPRNVDAINTLQWVMKKVPDSLLIRRQIDRSMPKLSPEEMQRVKPLIPPRN